LYVRFRSFSLVHLLFFSLVHAGGTFILERLGKFSRLARSFVRAVHSGPRDQGSSRLPQLALFGFLSALVSFVPTCTQSVQCIRMFSRRPLYRRTSSTEVFSARRLSLQGTYTTAASLLNSVLQSTVEHQAQEPGHGGGGRGGGQASASDSMIYRRKSPSVCSWGGRYFR